MSIDTRTERLLIELTEHANARPNRSPEITWATLDSLLLLVASLRAEVAELISHMESQGRRENELRVELHERVQQAKHMRGTITGLRAEVAALTEQNAAQRNSLDDAMLARAWDDGHTTGWNDAQAHEIARNTRNEEPDESPNPYRYPSPLPEGATE